MYCPYIHVHISHAYFLHYHSTFTPAYPIALEGALEAHRVLAVRHLVATEIKLDT